VIITFLTVSILASIYNKKKESKEIKEN